MERITIYFVDGTSLVYRSFFAIKLSNSQGFPTGSIYGVFNTLRKLTNKYHPEYMAVCFDVSRKTFRQEKFKDYKIKRPPMPGELKLQVPIIKKLIDALGISIVEKEGFEADDLIAALVKRTKKSVPRIVIVSSDKDMYQLIEKDNILVYNPISEKMWDESSFLKEFGFLPSQIVDFLALVGDSVDNIPGAKGIGKVTATRLIKSFGSVEEIFANVNKLMGSTKRIIMENRESILLSKELAKLNPEVDVSFSWKELRIGEPDYHRIYQIFKQLEFKSLLREIPLPSFELKVKIKHPPPDNWRERIEKKKRVFFFILLENIPSIFNKQGEYSYSSLQFTSQEKVLIWDEKEEVVYSVSLEEFKFILEKEEIGKISYDFKNLFKRFKIKGRCFDVMIAAYLVNSSLSDFSIEGICENFLKIFTKDTPEVNYPYLIFQIYKVLEKEIRKKNLEELFYQIEMPLVEILADMERWGIKVDIELLDEFFSQINTKIENLREEIFKLARRRFNLNSPKAVSEVLFKELNIPPLKKTKTGYSTNEEVLAKLSNHYPIARFLLEYRELAKLKSTYILPFKEEVKLNGGRLYTNFNQTGTQTGRLSSSSPNLQNIPSRGIGKNIRKVFVSSFEEGFILSSDYSQIELRILAHLSKEENLIEAFNKDADIHRYTASLLFNLPQDGGDEYREIAKRVNFGIIYGMSPFGLAKELNISKEEATAFIENYFLRYPKVKEFIEKIFYQVDKWGYVQTILGRRRYWNSGNGSNFELKEFIHRQAVNASIQGSAADIIKLAMNKIYRIFGEKNLRSKMVIQIHDELVFDVTGDEVNQVKGIVKENMVNVIRLDVPLKVNLKLGRNWLEMESLE
ncbi:MAG: DNA polymerase I [Candidatus Omnitrophica bacterium 4484_70.1]|nr:MAG: DNA polymerase I [Candidatus Omnitrophica bacterium 4484_70.1]